MATRTRRGSELGLTGERNAAWFGLLTVHASVTRAVESKLTAESDLSFSAYEVLYRLRWSDAQPARRLAAQIVSVSPTRVSRVVDDLVQRGLVLREPSTQDGRVSLVSLTAAGRAVLKSADRTFFEAVERSFFERLDDDDVAALARAWAKLRDCD